MNKNEAILELKELSNILRKLSIDHKYVDAIRTGIESTKYALLKEQEEKEFQMMALVEKLSEKIGFPIFWACKGWSMEQHKISSIKYSIYNGDFFKEYKGRKVILIYIDDNTGFYIYDELGKSIFFTKEEAEKSLQVTNETTEPNNRDKVRDWILKRYKVKRISGFDPMAIEKDLKIPIGEIYMYCGELCIEAKILQPQYHFSCDNCEFDRTYDSLSAVPDKCENCGNEIDKFEQTYIKFKFIRY